MIHGLAAESQTLDWDIPSQYERILENASRIDALAAEIEFETEAPPVPEYYPFADAARACMDELFGTTPVEFPCFPAFDLEPLTDLPRRGHLKLVWSRKD